MLALEAVLADLHAHAPDLTLNLGDHLSGPLQAAATADLLMAQRDWVHIDGNHDRHLIEQEPDAMGLLPGFPSWMSFQMSAPRHKLLLDGMKSASAQPERRLKERHPGRSIEAASGRSPFLDA